MSVLPIVVLYNVDYHTTNVYKTLFCHNSVNNVLLYENSPKPLNKRYASDSVFYHHDPNNGGVSAAYNYGASLAKQMDGIEALVLLDEDTIFEPDYVTVLEKLIEKHSHIGIFVPQIFYQGDKPFSPIHRKFCRNRGALLPEGKYSLLQYLPVNSGACVRLSLFEKAGGYNDRIRLDFADFDFFARVGELSDSFYKVNSIAFQSFSNDERDKDRLYKRYLLYLEGAREARKNKLIRRMVDAEVLRHTLALTIRTHSFRFIINYIGI